MRGMYKMWRNISLAIVVLFSFQLKAQELVDEISLNGTWNIVFDDANIGKKQQWYLDANFKNQAVEKIAVPSSWEELKEDYEGVAFYQKKVLIPSDWKDRVVNLQFDAVNFRTELWVNDKAVGEHEGGFAPFEFRIDKLLKIGEENTITLRVVSAIIMSGKEAIDGIGKQQAPQWRGAIAGGVWQPVRLKSMGNSKIKDVYVTTSVEEKSIDFQIALENTSLHTKEAQVYYYVKNDRGNLIQQKKEVVQLFPGTTNLAKRLKIDSPLLWDLDNPNLYTVEVVLKEAAAIQDKFQHKIGFREFTFDGEQYLLNGKRLYLQACFFEGLYPVKGAYPDSEAMARKEIQLAKDAGFNMIRPWRKPPPKMWLDLCDEMGMLTVGSNVVECMFHPLSSVHLTRWVENEIKTAVLRDRNRTCVVLWELFNEIQRPVLGQLLQPMSAMARELDPSRLILDESGGFAQGSRLYAPYQRVGERFNDVHNYSGSQTTELVYNKYLLMGTSAAERKQLGFTNFKPAGHHTSEPGKKVFVSEMGYGSSPNFVSNVADFNSKGNAKMPAARYTKRIHKQTEAAMKLTGFDALYDSSEAFYADQQVQHGRVNKRLIEATRTNPNTVGFCIHAFIGGDWVLGAGIVDLWRNPKGAAYSMTAEANKKQLVSLRIIPRNSFAGKNPKITITGVNDGVVFKKSTVALEVVDASGKVVFEKLLQTDFEAGIQEFYNENLTTKNLKGSYTAKVIVKDKQGNSIATTERTFDVFAKEKANVRSIAVVDFQNRLSRFCKNNQLEFEQFSAKTKLDKIVVVAKASPNNKTFLAQMQVLETFVNKGGKVILLDPRSLQNLYQKQASSSFKIEISNSKGLWSGYPHMIQEHPIFEGLPTKQILNKVYENVHPTYSFVKQPTPYIAGTVYYKYYTGENLDTQYHLGPTNVEWASDLQLKSIGEGRVLFNSFQIFPQLGADPVAEKLLFNMLDFLHNNK